MCSLTVPFSSSGDWQHRKLGEDPCRECKDARNEASRKRRRQRGNENAKWNKLWHRYRIRPDDYISLLLSQDGKCALCLKDFNSASDLHLDHDHSCDHPEKGERSCRGCVRAILCMSCNVRLVAVEKDEWLALAIEYLRRKACPAG